MEENKRIVRRFSEEHHTSLENVGKVVDELLAPRLRQPCAPFPDVPGPGASRHRIAGTYGASPAARFVVENVTAEGDRAVVG